MKNYLSGRKGALFAAALLIFGGAAAFAQESVDSAELRRAEGPVEFISNTARPVRIDTREEILDLGRAPGSAVRGGAETSGARGRYFVIHRLYPEEFDKLDADIFGLGVGAGVDTIGNLRLILQGYLQRAYDYTPADAALLAEYITIYNAVYRRNRAYFSQRFKTPLLDDLTPGSEGIALRYDEWPGSTLLLIPLMNGAAGSLSAIDTSTITDAMVVDKMREDEDRGIPSRQGMVELKEREADAAEAAAAKLRQTNAEEERRVTAEKERVAAEQRKLAEDKAKLEAEAAAASTPAERAAAKAKQAELAQREAELAESQGALDEKSAELAESKNAAAEAAEFAERKAVEAQQERESIAADQRDLIGVAQAKAAETGVLAVRLTGQSSPRGTIVKVNPSSGATLQTSPLNQVAGRTLTCIGGKTVAVAASGGNRGLSKSTPRPCRR